MTYIDVEEAVAIWSDLIARVEAAEAFVLKREGKPIATLAPYAERKPGAMKGQIDIGEEFFDPLPEEELRAWE